MNLLTFCKEKVEPAKIKNNYKFDEETKREIFKEENTYESATDESRLSGDKNADTRGISSTTNEGTDDSMKNHDITSEPEEDSKVNDLKNSLMSGKKILLRENGLTELNIIVNSVVTTNQTTKEV